MKRIKRNKQRRGQVGAGGEERKTYHREMSLKKTVAEGIESRGGEKNHEKREKKI